MGEAVFNDITATRPDDGFVSDCDAARTQLWEAEENWLLQLGTLLSETNYTYNIIEVPTGDDCSKKLDKMVDIKGGILSCPVRTATCCRVPSDPIYSAEGCSVPACADPSATTTTTPGTTTTTLMSPPHFLCGCGNDPDFSDVYEQCDPARITFEDASSDCEWCTTVKCDGVTLDIKCCEKCGDTCDSMNPCCQSVTTTTVETTTTTYGTTTTTLPCAIYPPKLLCGCNDEPDFADICTRCADPATVTFEDADTECQSCTLVKCAGVLLDIKCCNKCGGTCSSINSCCSTVTTTTITVSITKDTTTTTIGAGQTTTTVTSDTTGATTTTLVTTDCDVCKTLQEISGRVGTGVQTLDDISKTTRTISDRIMTLAEYDRQIRDELQRETDVTDVTAEESSTLSMEILKTSEWYKEPDMKAKLKALVDTLPIVNRIKSAKITVENPKCSISGTVMGKDIQIGFCDFADKLAEFGNIIILLAGVVSFFILFL